MGFRQLSPEYSPEFGGTHESGNAGSTAVVGGIT
jgi:hypothetical protein